MANLTIWLIQIGEPLPLTDDVRKMRTAILADALNARGHSVVWWASAFDHFAKDWIFDDDAEITSHGGLKIKALKGTGYKKNISLARFIDHRLIARKFRRAAPLLEKPDIIVTASPSYDLAYEAVCFAHQNNVPVLVDIRDEWPDMFLHYVPSFSRSLVRLLLRKDFFMIREVMQKASGLTAMMDSLLLWGLTYAKREKSITDKVFYLGFQKPGNYSNSIPIAKLSEKIKGKFVVTFIGSFGHNNDPSILIDCARALEHHDIHFVLAGSGQLFEFIKAKASSARNVTLTGWLGENDINSLLGHSHVGVCPSAEARAALPNKTFAYLSAGLPLLSSYHGDMKEVIEKYSLGYYYPPNNDAALTKCIRSLHEDKDLYRTMSENARRFFRRHGDAEKIYDDFAMHIENTVRLHEVPA